MPLCCPHHQDLHRCGNEKAWWANMQIAPMAIAKAIVGGESDRQQRRRDSGQCIVQTEKRDSPGSSKGGGDSDSNSAGNEEAACF